MDARTATNIVLTALIFNVIILALAFAVISGVAALSPQYAPVRGLFAPAVGFLSLVAVFLGTVRSMLVDLLADLAS